MKVVFIRRGRYQIDEAKRTQVDDVAVELSHELRRIKLERTDVLGVQATLDVDGNPGSTINVTNGYASNIDPLIDSVLVRDLRYIDMLPRIHLALRRLLWAVAPRFRLQLNNLSSPVTLNSYSAVTSSRRTWQLLTQSNFVLGAPPLSLFSWKNRVTLP